VKFLKEDSPTKQPATKTGSGTNTEIESSSRPVLKNIDFLAQPGEFVAIIGSVGSGKTALLLSMMSELVI